MGSIVTTLYQCHHAPAPRGGDDYSSALRVGCGPAVERHEVLTYGGILRPRRIRIGQIPWGKCWYYASNTSLLRGNGVELYLSFASLCQSSSERPPLQVTRPRHHVANPMEQKLRPWPNRPNFGGGQKLSNGSRGTPPPFFPAHHTPEHLVGHAPAHTGTLLHRP